eukprot:TRINITY_DN6257_c0_g1_i2.p1 TRINITY_DN6257_c0_g1~~TRINITY_DN6257_c0_g1_i2.p1  ORF type:complete len:529 (+),score=129.08 TRINITY_DN6257_c0_g1_i2:171-1757(+)
MAVGRSVVALCFIAFSLSCQAAYLEEDFNDVEAWTKSEAKKVGASSDIAQYDGTWSIKNGSVVMATGGRHYGLARKLSTPATMTDKPFVVQYEVKFENGMSCGGSYVKLLEEPQEGELKLKELTDQTPFTFMFGPDKCGADAHLRFIFRYRNPKTNEFNEVHAKRVLDVNERLYDDQRTHLVTLVVKPDSTFVMKIDNEQVSQGDMRSNEDFDPALFPVRTIDDPDDVKPADWIDDEYMNDPSDVKPAEWDETAPMYIDDQSAVMPEDWDEDAPELIEDMDAVKPEDWDDEDDGEWERPKLRNPKCDTGCGKWEPPQVKNPDYKGKWKPRRIKNPDYKGVWTPKQLPNPEYFEDKNPVQSLRAVAAVAFELWTVTSGVHFDNLLITDDVAQAQAWAEQRWKPKFEAEAPSMAFAGLEQLQGYVNFLQEAADANPYLYIAYTLVVSVIIATMVMTCCPGHDEIVKTEPDQANDDDKVAEPSPDHDATATATEDGETTGSRTRRVSTYSMRLRLSCKPFENISSGFQSNK